MDKPLQLRIDRLCGRGEVGKDLVKNVLHEGTALRADGGKSREKG